MTEEFWKRALIYTDWFKEEEKLRVDESKRKGGKASRKNKKSDKDSTSHDSSENLSLRTLAID